MQLQTIDCPVLGLDSGFPSKLFVLKHEPTGKYGCYSFDGIHGLACFSDETGATDFSLEINLSGMSIIEVSFDEAREIAQGRPLPIISIILLDDLSDPQIHYVR